MNSLFTYLHWSRFGNSLQPPLWRWSISFHSNTFQLKEMFLGFHFRMSPFLLSANFRRFQLAVQNHVSPFSAKGLIVRLTILPFLYDFRDQIKWEQWLSFCFWKAPLVTQGKRRRENKTKTNTSRESIFHWPLRGNQCQTHHTNNCETQEQQNSFWNVGNAFNSTLPSWRPLTLRPREICDGPNSTLKWLSWPFDWFV